MNLGCLLKQAAEMAVYVQSFLLYINALCLVICDNASMW
jgi:hypothetical protein